MTITERNATIESTMLGIEDHGILTFYIYLDYGGAGQGFGGYVMDEPINDGKGHFLKRRGAAYGCDSLLQILRTLKVGKWESLPGTPCRVRQETGKVHAIGHYLRNEWFVPADHAKEWEL